MIADLIEKIPNETDEQTGIVTEYKYYLNTNVSKQILEFEKQMKFLKEKEDELKKKILEEMETKNIIKLETEELIISYITPTSKEVFDSKLFREEHSDLYDDYVKLSQVKSSVRIKVR